MSWKQIKSDAVQADRHALEAETAWLDRNNSTSQVLTQPKLKACTNSDSALHCDDETPLYKLNLYAISMM